MRHEVKYLAKISDVESFFKELEPFCHFDKHAGITKSYEIASIYYDTKDLRFYRDREESVGYRRKIRLRSYNDNGESQALFIEIKEKHREFVKKKRINLRSDNQILQSVKLHDQIPLDLVIDQLEDTAEAREIEYLHKRLGLYPVNLIRYIRRPLIPTTDPTMRITFDTKITSGGHCLDKFDPELEKYICDPDCGVLEIKTFDTIPLWLASILKRYDFMRTRFSKYCLGVDAIYGSHRPWIAFGGQISDGNAQQVIA